MFLRRPFTEACLLIYERVDSTGNSAISTRIVVFRSRGETGQAALTNETEQNKMQACRRGIPSQASYGLLKKSNEQRPTMPYLSECADGRKAKVRSTSMLR
jgi:hypothetical protein